MFLAPGMAGDTEETRRRLKEAAVAEWDRVMAVDAKGPFLVSRSAIPALTAPGGSIVYVHSGHAQLGSPGRAVSSASKGALGSMIKAWRSNSRRTGSRSTAWRAAIKRPVRGGRSAARTSPRPS
jgi:NAD(P)-dependent dehydrogenase (short-subunit alcohol dehydrogenase family)